MRDPHPRVDGQGIAILREAGVAVIDGILEANVRKQLGLWVIEHHPHEPLRRAQALMSDDLIERLAEIYGVSRARVRALLEST